MNNAYSVTKGRLLQMKPIRLDPVGLKSFQLDPVQTLSDSDWRTQWESQENRTDSYRILLDFVGFRRYPDRNPTAGLIDLADLFCDTTTKKR